MPEGTLVDDLQLALALADAADAISLDRFGAQDLQVTAKADLTPVSDADLAVERTLRELLGVHRPADRVIGEEFGAQALDITGRSWVLDPIDGTKNFVRRVPVWATLIAMFDGGRPVLGVVSAPALARRWWGATGLGAWSCFAGQHPRLLAVSEVSEMANASLSYSDLAEWQKTGRAQQFAQLLDDCWRTRAYGDFYSYMLVAEGAVDIAAEPELSLWDVAALAPIVTEAGGIFTDLDGGSVGRDTVSALASTRGLHEKVRTRLAADRHVTPR